MEAKNEALEETIEWLATTAESSTKRYIEAEEFIMELYALPWYKRFTINSRIYNFMVGRLKKYKTKE